MSQTENGALQKDENGYPVMGGVSSSDNETVLNAQIDPVTGRLLVDNAGGGSGSVTSVAVETANGFAGTVADPTGNAAITMETTITGILKGDGTAMSAASAGTDYTNLAYKTISVSGQSDVVADSAEDTLTLVAGSNVTITTDASTDSITIAASGGSGGTPGGSDTQIQYNNAGAFGGISTFTTDGTNMTIANNTNLNFGGGTGNSTALKTGSDGTFLFDTGANMNIKFKGTSGGSTDWGYTDGAFNYVFHSDSSGNTTQNGTITTGTNGGTLGAVLFNGSTSGTTTLEAAVAASGTLTLPAATDTLVGRATTDTLTNKTIAGAAISGAFTGTGAYIPVSLLNSGTSASSTTFWRGDGTWATPAGGGSPGGSNTQVQFNSSGSFAGDSGLTYDSTGKILTISNTQIGKVDSPNEGIIFTEEGGTASIAGSDAVSANTAGTAVTLVTGSGNGSGDGGILSNAAGFGGTTGNGGSVTFSGGFGGTTSGNGGDINMVPGGILGTGTAGHVHIRDASSSIDAILDTSSLASANKTFTFPNASGTLALTSDITDTVTIGTTSVASGTSGRVLFDNAGILGQYNISGSGNVALTTSPVFTTPSLGVATATSINKVTITAPASSSTLTIANGSSLITSGAFALTLTSTATSNATIPSGTNTLYSTKSGSITSSQLATSLSDETGTGSAVFATSPNLVTTATTGISTTDLYASNNHAVTVSSNAGTCSQSFELNTFTNSSAATMAITLGITSPTPKDGQKMIVRVYDFSAVAQTIGWTNTEDSTVAAPTTSNGSTTLPLTVGFMYNSATSKWRCIAKA